MLSAATQEQGTLALIARLIVCTMGPVLSQMPGLLARALMPAVPDHSPQFWQIWWSMKASPTGAVDPNWLPFLATRHHLPTLRRHASLK
jgi:hypothetical protein